MPGEKTSPTTNTTVGGRSCTESKRIGNDFNRFLVEDPGLGQSRPNPYKTLNSKLVL